MTVLPRILLLLSLLFSGLVLVKDAHAKDVVRVGVLQYGTVNWEMQAIEHLGLQNNYDIQVEAVPLASTQALLVALQGGKVDVILNDWLWVARQKGLGREYRFAPYSANGGQLVVRSDADIHALRDLKGKTIGIAGGKANKNWVLFKTFIQKETGLVLGEDIAVKFGAPPMLNALVKQGDLDGVLNFWHYAAQLNAEGMPTLLTMEGLLKASGVDTALPVLGWVFSADWASEHTSAVNQFLALSSDAKQRMKQQDDVWQSLPAFTRYPEPAQPYLIAGFRDGVLTLADGQTEQAMANVFAMLVANQEDNDVTGNLTALPEAILWQWE